MALYLVQHGKSLSKEIDPRQGLSEEGRADTRRIAEVAAGYRVPVSAIWHSTKTRARQTAEIMAEYLHPEKGVLEKEGLKPLDDVAAFAARIPEFEDIMLVGHLPFMARMTSHLILGKQEPPVFKFQNSGIVCLRKTPEDPHWLIAWTLMPHIG